MIEKTKILKNKFKKRENIFGGWISPKNVGYDFHTNIYIEHKMSPCGNKIL